ncbi:hypothetical protein U1Q18_028811 [Sarracenia purpurea var. burkii]
MMYRSAANRLLLLPSLVRCGRPQISPIGTLIVPNSPRFSSTSASSSQDFSDHGPSYPHKTPPQPQAHSQTPKVSESASSSSSQSSVFSEEDGSRSESQTSRDSPPRAEYQDEQVRVLSASLRHVISAADSIGLPVDGGRTIDEADVAIGEKLQPLLILDLFKHSLPMLAPSLFELNLLNHCHGLDEPEPLRFAQLVHRFLRCVQGLVGCSGHGILL